MRTAIKHPAPDRVKPSFVIFDSPSTSLQDVFRATVVAKVTYYAPAWSGASSAADRARLDSFLNRCKRLGFADTDMSSITELFSDADDAFFERTEITTIYDMCAAWQQSLVLDCRLYI